MPEQAIAGDQWRSFLRKTDPFGRRFHWIPFSTLTNLRHLRLSIQNQLDSLLSYTDNNFNRHFLSFGDQIGAAIRLRPRFLRWGPYLSDHYCWNTCHFLEYFSLRKLWQGSMRRNHLGQRNYLNHSGPAPRSPAARLQPPKQPLYNIAGQSVGLVSFLRWSGILRRRMQDTPHAFGICHLSCSEFDPVCPDDLRHH